MRKRVLCIWDASIKRHFTIFRFLTANIWFLHLCKEVSWELHPHEEPCCEEWNEDWSESDHHQHGSVQFGNVGSVWFVQQDESESSNCEKERRSQPFHDVLSVYSVSKESNRSGISLVINSLSNTWGFDNHVIDDTSSN